MGHMSAWPLRLLALVLCLPAGAAAAERVRNQGGARADRVAPAQAEWPIQDALEREGADESDETAHGQPGEVTGALPQRAASSPRSRATSRAEGPAPRRSVKPVAAPKAVKPKAPARQPAAAKPHARRAVPLPPERPEPAPVTAATDPTPQPDTTGSVETPMAWPELPVPPSPTVIETVTYDFTTGVKRTVLRDGMSYQEAFDPKAFHRLGAAPPVAAGQRSDAAQPSGGPAPPELK